MTLQTIADAIGADRGTVSRVLRGRAADYHISEKRAAMIQRTADRLGYRPNQLGRALRSGRNPDVGLLMSADATNWLPDALLAGLLDGLAISGYTLRIKRLDFTCPKSLADRSESHHPDGSHGGWSNRPESGARGAIHHPRGRLHKLLLRGALPRNARQCNDRREGSQIPKAHVPLSIGCQQRPEEDAI